MSKTPDVNTPVDYEALYGELQGKHTALEQEHAELTEGVQSLLTTKEGLLQLDEIVLEAKKKVGIAPTPPATPLVQLKLSEDASDDNKLIAAAIEALTARLEEKDKVWKEGLTKLEDTWKDSSLTTKAERLAATSLEVVESKTGLKLTAAELATALRAHGDDPVKAVMAAYPERVLEALKQAKPDVPKPNHLKTEQGGPPNPDTMTSMERMQFFQQNPEALDAWNNDRQTEEHQRKLVEIAVPAHLAPAAS